MEEKGVDAAEGGGERRRTGQASREEVEQQKRQNLYQPLLRNMQFTPGGVIGPRDIIVDTTTNKIRVSSEEPEVKIKSEPEDEVVPQIIKVASVQAEESDAVIVKEEPEAVVVKEEFDAAVVKEEPEAVVVKEEPDAVVVKEEPDETPPKAATSAFLQEENCNLEGLEPEVKEEPEPSGIQICRFFRDGAQCQFISRVNNAGEMICHFQDEHHAYEPIRDYDIGWNHKLKFSVMERSFPNVWSPLFCRVNNQDYLIARRFTNDGYLSCVCLRLKEEQDGCNTVLEWHIKSQSPSEAGDMKMRVPIVSLLEAVAWLEDAPTRLQKSVLENHYLDEERKLHFNLTLL